MNRILRWCPGAIGLWLRQKFYRHRFGRCGRNVLFGRFLNCTHPEKIHIGSNVVFGDNVTLDGSGGADCSVHLTIGDEVYLGAGTTLQLGVGPITIGSGSSISSSCLVLSGLAVTLGRKVLVAAYVTIGRQLENEVEPLVSQVTDIQSGCWLGARAVIGQGVSVGEGSVVGAHALVNEDLPSRVVAVGRPAKAIAAREAPSETMA